MIGWMWRSRNAPVVCISVRRVCHCRKQSGSRKRAASGRIFSLAFPATLWNLRDQPRVAARIIFFLAPSSPRLRNRHWGIYARPPGMGCCNQRGVVLSEDGDNRGLDFIYILKISKIIFLETV